MTVEIAKGVFIALTMFGALCWAIRLWTYAPPVEPRLFSNIRMENRMKAGLLMVPVIAGIFHLWGVT